MEIEMSQYKQLIHEEVVLYLENGYYDHALRFVNEFMLHFPEDQEGYWAYSLIFAVRKDINRSFEYMKKALDGGLSLSRFTLDSSTLFDSLTESKLFQDYIKEKELKVL